MLSLVNPGEPPDGVRRSSDHVNSKGSGSKNAAF